MQTIYYFILVPMVYIAFGIFVVGTIIRLIKIFTTPAHPTTLQIYPEKKFKWLGTFYPFFLYIIISMGIWFVSRLGLSL